MTTDDDREYRRRMDERLISFLSAHEVWMINDTNWKRDTTARLNSHANRIASLERWRTWALGVAAAVGAGFGWLTGGNKR